MYALFALIKFGYLSFVDSEHRANLGRHESGVAGEVNLPDLVVLGF